MARLLEPPPPLSPDLSPPLLLPVFVRYNRIRTLAFSSLHGVLLLLANLGRFLYDVRVLPMLHSRRESFQSSGTVFLDCSLLGSTVKMSTDV